MQKNNSAVKQVLRDALILFVITLIAGFSLSFVNQKTKSVIEAKALAQVQKSYQKIFPAEGVKFESTDITKDLKKDSLEITKKRGMDTKGLVVEDCRAVMDSSKHVIGHVFTIFTPESYSGAMKLAVGVREGGIVTGVTLLENTDTPGLGQKASDDAFLSQFKDKQPEAFQVVKHAPANDKEIEAISGATITSEAVSRAVNMALILNFEAEERGGSK